MTTNCSRSETKPNIGLPATAPVFWSGSSIPRNPLGTNLLLQVFLSFYLFLRCSNFHLTVYPLSCFPSSSLFARLFLLVHDTFSQLPHDFMVLLPFPLSSLQPDRCSCHTFFPLHIFKTYKIINEGPNTSTDGCLNPSYTWGAHLGSLRRYQKIFPSS